MSGRSIESRLLDDGTTVRLVRGEDVPDAAWLQVRAEWGSLGRDVARELLVPLERFLARRAAFGALAKRSGLAVHLDDSLRGLVLKANEDQGKLRDARNGLTSLTKSDLAPRLEGGRFVRELRGFQERDLGRLLALAHGANFSVPGAGKTAV